MDMPASKLREDASMMGIVACIVASAVWDLAGLVAGLKFLWRVGAATGRFLYRVSIARAGTR